MNLIPDCPVDCLAEPDYDFHHLVLPIAQIWEIRSVTAANRLLASSHCLIVALETGGPSHNGIKAAATLAQ